MFRLVYMTFYGENRSDEHTREHLHESPAVMTYPLVILAGLAAVAGLLGVPEALFGSNRIHEWLAPVMGGHGGGHGEHHAAHDTTMEYILMAASIGMAVGGILLARAMYGTKSIAPERFSDIGDGAPHRLLYNKYYVDELYEATIINGTLFLTRLCAAFDRYVVDFLVNTAATVTRFVSWLNGLFDSYVIDGLVNRVADVTMSVGDRVRRLQTGNINGYLYVAVASVLVVMIARLL